MTQLLQNSWAFSNENLGNNMFFKIYIGEAHMGYTQGSSRHFEVEPIHLAFAFNQFKSKNGSAFLVGPNFDNQLKVICMTFIRL